MVDFLMAQQLPRSSALVIHFLPPFTNIATSMMCIMNTSVVMAKGATALFCVASRKNPRERYNRGKLKG